MGVFRIEDSGNTTLSRAEKLLAGIEGGLEKATKSAMSRAIAHLRTNSGRVIRERYAISQANLRSEQNIKVRYTFRDGVQAEILFAGRKIPLYRYNGTSPKQPTTDPGRTITAIIHGQWKTLHPSVPAAGHLLNGTSPVRFDSAFVARMPSGHTGIFERTGGSTSTKGDAIRELMGLSVPQMLGNEHVTEKLANETMAKFDERLGHEVDRILNGWNG